VTIGRGVLFVKHQTRDVENDVRDKGTSGGRILQLGATWAVNAWLFPCLLKDVLTNPRGAG
jgi:hypothetical protein